ncbi:MAG TPA: hypothetical protein VIV57_05925 [Anaeromyxobacter sp.]
MAKRKYALERGGPKRLFVRWRRGFKDFEVAFEGKAWKLDPALLAGGASLTLADGSSLLVQRLKRRWWSIGLRDELHVERDGVPVPGSDGDPRVLGRRAASVLLLFGLLRVLFVGLWFTFQRVGGGGAVLNPVAAEGALLAVLGILAAFGLRLPVLLGAALLVAELLVSVASGLRVGPFALVIQVLVIVHLVRTWRRMRPRERQPSLASVFE